VAEEETETPRPNLQIMSGSDVVIEIFWLSPDGERVSNYNSNALRYFLTI
tara:strand:+ start:4103 stop:4252 length:150 start_codon:yes stop_codon:yes gene_type:complete